MKVLADQHPRINTMTSKTVKTESHTRSILKAVTWRLIASLTTFLLAYLVFSGSKCDDVLEKSTIVAALELVIKLIIYYLHERAWTFVPSGTFKKSNVAK
jgi:uncharacterized membrane protein